MAETIFRYIDGVLRPIKVSNIKAGKQSVTTVNQHRQIPKQKLAPGHYRTPHAFTIPNATCQVCGAKVFYYEHPNGARVLFDHLGPPWPKHPCYEVMQKGKGRKTAITTSRTDWTPWRQALWSPAVVQAHVLSEDGENVKVMAIGDSRRVFFELPLPQLRNRDLTLEGVADLLVQVQEITATTFNVQLHDGKSSWCVTGYRSEVENGKQVRSALSAPPQAVIPNRKAAVVSDHPRLGDKAYRKLKAVKRFEYRWDEQGCVVTLYEDSILSVVKITSREALAFRHLEFQWEAMLGKRSQGGYRRLLMVNPTTRHFFSCLLDADTLKPREEQGVIPSMNKSVVEEHEEIPANKDVHNATSTIAKSREPKKRSIETTLSSIDFVGDNYLVVRFQIDASPVCFALHRASRQSRMILTALLQQDQAPLFLLKAHHQKKRYYEIYLDAALLGSMSAIKNLDSSADSEKVSFWADRNSTFL